MILLIDNYDSFSYNLFQMAGSIDPNIQVIRNDAMHVLEISNLAPSHIILSPGPGRPADSGVCREVVRILGPRVPILGVCLGHQAICEAYGGRVGYAKTLMHGKPSRITQLGNSSLFAGMPAEFQGARYHSLAADESALPPCLEVTARAEDGEIMAMRHREYPVYGLQFHPESILTPLGHRILQNFLGSELRASL
ncbi:MAG: aminodeoxychorismate/anthranilate synthase component II [Oscillospiraceae bacterium]|nr:aminodeoxychorismate/anthranilate synthase component II [Oscillospiraceae bacterium]